MFDTYDIAKEVKKKEKKYHIKTGHGLGHNMRAAYLNWACMFLEKYNKL